MATRASTAITISSSWSTTNLPTVATPVWQPTQTNLGATTPSSWASLFLELNLANGSTPPVKGVEITVNWAFSGTVTSNPSGITHPLVFTNSGWFTILSNPTANFTYIGTSPSIPILGDYLYTWLEISDNLNSVIVGSLTATQTTAVTSQIYQT